MKLVFSLLVMLVLSGCQSLPDAFKTFGDAGKKRIKSINNEWSTDIPPVREVVFDGDWSIQSPLPVPSYIRGIPFKSNFVSEASIEDMTAAISQLGITVIIPDEDVRRKKMGIPSYNGYLGDFLDAIEVGYDVSFTYRENNILVAKPTHPFMIRVPQNKEIIEELTETITKLGAVDVSSSIIAGIINYKASSFAQQSIQKYLSTSNINVSMISIQMAVVTVSLDENMKEGFDWNALNYASGSSITGDAAELGKNLRDGIAGMVGGSGGTAIKLAKGDFTLGAAINFLSTYGNTQSSQSVMLRSLSGRETGFSSGNSVPYVAEIGNVIAGSTTAVTQTSTNIQELDTGLKIKVKPFYDDHTKLITIDFDLELTSLIGFIELNVGNELGTVSRPQTQRQTFNDLLRLSVGESVVIGGLIFETETKNYNVPSFLKTLFFGGKEESYNKTAMFILMRPTVTVFKASIRG